MTRVVQMTLDDKLVAQVDAEARKSGISRSRLTREALVKELFRRRIAEMEEQERRSFEALPVQPEERFMVEPVWADESWEES
jgi:metal-responsive CopG/Arc/MetJ family transcriptional regulator